MGIPVRVRLANAGDGRALSELMARSPDAGNVAFTYRFAANPLAVMQALGTCVEGAVACVEGAAAGMVLGDFGEVQWSGARRPGVYVSNLRVDPERRRSGVGRALATWGLEYVEGRLGPEAVVYSAVMEGNAVGAMLIEQLGFEMTAPVRGALVPPRRTPPRRRRDLEVRPATSADWPGVVEGVNAFYARHNLWSPVSEASLSDFVAREVDGVRPNELHVVTRGGEVLAGLSLSDRTALVRMLVIGASPPVRAVGRAVGLLPADGALRALTTRHVWFRPGELAAARLLWQTLRYAARARGGCLGIAFDPRDSLSELFRLPRWLPTFPARYLVRAPAPLESARTTYCIAGA